MIRVVVNVSQSNQFMNSSAQWPVLGNWWSQADAAHTTAVIGNDQTGTKPWPLDKTEL